MILIGHIPFMAKGLWLVYLAGSLQVNLSHSNIWITGFGALRAQETKKYHPEVAMHT